VGIRIKRVYEPPEGGDGYRMLVDRLWPRGVKKEKAKIDLWMRDIAPSNELRKWFGRDPKKWEEFKTRYFEELDARRELAQDIAERAQKEPVTLLYAKKDEQYNNALCLKDYIEAKLS